MSEPNLNHKLEQKLREALDAPAPDTAFANRLRTALIAKAAEMKPEPKSSQLVWRLAFATIVLLLLGFFFGPKIVTAMKQLFGYVPGVGLVDQSLPLRVLAEPVSLTRDGVVLTVKSAVLSADKSVVNFSLKNVPWDALSHQENVPGCTGMASLRLPDGTVLASGDGGGTMNDITFSYPALAVNVSEATFLLPCIQSTLPGKAPENWELALHFVPAPPDFKVAPVVNVAPTASPIPAVKIPAEIISTAVPNPVTILKVVDLPDGYLIAGTFQPVDLPLGADSMWPSGLYSVTDANGREVYSSESSEQLLPFPTDPTIFNWALQIKGKDFAFPLTIAMNGIQANSTSNLPTFEFDAGENPQTGQVFTTNIQLQISARQVMINTIRFTGTGYYFDLTTDPDVTNIGVSIAGYPDNGSDGGPIESGHLFASLEYENPLPKGKLSITLNGIAFHEPGPWTVQWQPDGVQTGLISSLYGISLAIDKFIPLDDGYYLIGHTVWTDKRISRVSLGDWSTRAYDAAGNEIPLEAASRSDAGIDTNDPNQWVYKIYGKAFNGPVTLQASEATLGFASPPMVEIDLQQYGFTGAEDQIGYIYKVGMLPLDLPGLIVKIQSLAYLRERDLKGFSINFEADPAITSLPLDMLPTPAGAQRGSGGSSRGADGRLVDAIYSDGTITGQFTLTATTANISGKWEAQWQPPVVDASAKPDSPTPACLSLANWKEAAQNPAAIPAIGGKLVIYGRILNDSQPPSPENYGVLLTDLTGIQKHSFGKGVNPSISADGSVLAYNWNDGIHIVATVSGQDTILPGLNPDDFGPKLSPDGRTLVFVRPADMNLYLINSDGSGLRLFTNTPAIEEYAQGWTNDGGKVLYLKIDSGQQSLVAKSISDGQETTLLAFPTSVGALALSPDGGRLAYSAPVRGRMAGGIYLARLDGSSPPKLFAQLDHWIVDSPVWSPDGNWLLINIVDMDAYSTPATSALLNSSSCDVIPVNAFEGTALGWSK